MHKSLPLLYPKTQQICIYEHAFRSDENQLFQSTTLPNNVRKYATLSGLKSMDRFPQNIVLPTGYQWKGPWKFFVSSKETDEEGWTYAASFDTLKHSLRTKPDLYDKVRRRKWVRQMVQCFVEYQWNSKVPPEHQSIQLKTRYSNQKNVDVIWKKGALGITFHASRVSGSTEIKQTSRADVCPRMQLTHINNNSVVNEKFDSVMKLLKTTPRPTKLQFSPAAANLIIIASATTGAQAKGLFAEMALAAINHRTVEGLTAAKVKEMVARDPERK